MDICLGKYLCNCSTIVHFQSSCGFCFVFFQDTLINLVLSHIQASSISGMDQIILQVQSSDCLVLYNCLCL